MIQQSGVQWDVERFETGHAPFLSQPESLGQWTVAKIEGFATVDEEGEDITFS